MIMAPLHQAARYIFTLSACTMPFLSNFFNFYGTNDQEVDAVVTNDVDDDQLEWFASHRNNALGRDAVLRSSKYTFRSQSQLIYNFARGNSNRLFFATSLTQSLSLTLFSSVLAGCPLSLPGDILVSVSRHPSIHPSEGNKTIYATTTPE